MLQFLPLPILWLFFYALGRLSRGRALSLRHYLLTAASLLILLGAAGPVTFAFFAAVGLAIVLVGAWLQRLAESKLRTIARPMAAKKAKVTGPAAPSRMNNEAAVSR